MTLSSFRAIPRKGHLERAHRIIIYINNFKDAAIRIKTDMPDLSQLPDQDFKWKNTVYGNVTELLPTDAPEPLGKPVITVTYVDTNLMHDVLTGKSVTGAIDLINQTPFDWYSKKQSTVETATYGSEFVAAHTATERIIDHRNTLRYLGVCIGRSYMFGDNESVVNSSTIPNAKLHKRHTMLSFHQVRDAIASNTLSFYHIDGKLNPADILSKHWALQAVWPMMQPLLFYAEDTSKLLFIHFVKAISGSGKEKGNTVPPKQA